jgi:hypothetical protein
MVYGVSRRTGVGGGVGVPAPAPAPAPAPEESSPPIIIEATLEDEQHTIIRPTPANIGIDMLDVYYYTHIFL